METVSIRNLRGTRLRQSARSGKPLAITNHRALIGVFIPVAVAWVEHIIDYNWSHVRQSIAEGEQAIAGVTPMTTLAEVLAKTSAADAQETGTDCLPDRLAIPLVAAVAGNTIAQAPHSKMILERLQAAFAPPVPGRQAQPATSSVRTVRIGDLSAGLIERAGSAGETVALTHDRELIGMVIPVTQGLLQFLIEQNLSRVLYNIGLSEKQIDSAGSLVTLDEVAGAEGEGGVPG